MTVIRTLMFIAGQLLVAAFFIGVYLCEDSIGRIIGWIIAPFFYLAIGVSHLAFAATIVLVSFILAAWIHARVRQ